MFLSGYCGILAELSLFTLAESLVGGTLMNLFMTMGVMMFCMGLGSALAGWRRLSKASYGSFIALETGISISTALSIPLLTFWCGAMPHLAIPAFALISALIGTLIGMEIPIMQKVMERETGKDIQVIASRVLMVDYFGGLCGFLAFSALLLHHIGLPWTALSGGALNLIIALLLLHLRPCPRSAMVVAYLGSLVLGVYAIELDGVMERGVQNLYRHKIVWAHQSPYQKLVLTDGRQSGEPSYNHRQHRAWQAGFDTLQRFTTASGNAEVMEEKGELALFINGGLQFHEKDEALYHQHLVHPAFAVRQDIEKVLVMGGGDGMALRELLRWEQVKAITLVEFDPAMTLAFSTEPRLRQLNGDSLLDPRVQVVHEDAWNWARQQSERFDLIVLDFPDPHQIETAKLYSLQFYRLLEMNLNPGGLIVTQATSPLYDQKGYWCIGKTLEAAGYSILPYHVEMVSFAQWGFHMASLEVDESEMRSRLENWKDHPPFEHIDAEALTGATRWSPSHRRSRRSAPVNDFLHLPLLKLYRAR